MSQKNKSHAQFGFTLIEIVVVLVIIAVLSAGVVAGRQLLRNTEVNAVSNDMAKIQKAVKKFEQAYGGLPGDLANASKDSEGGEEVRAGIWRPTGRFSERFHGSFQLQRNNLWQWQWQRTDRISHRNPPFLAASFRC